MRRAPRELQHPLRGHLAIPIFSSCELTNLLILLLFEGRHAEEFESNLFQPYARILSLAPFAAGLAGIRIPSLQPSLQMGAKQESEAMLHAKAIFLVNLANLSTYDFNRRSCFPDS